ncbi:MAG: redoxin domain-containing protein [Candidatus Latescibacteria bacterium]|nr:redoxin domain-containing protein [Candidatus Latescibacterota bacterium]
MSVTVGSKAPDFTLKTKTDKGMADVTLSSFQEKQNVILLFFPLAYTGVCTQEMCAVRDGLKEYQNLNAQVLGLSVDSPFAQEAWAKQEKLNFPLLSDFNKEICAAYGAQYADLMGFKGVAKRSAFVIDRQGIVRYASVSDDAKQLPDFNAIKACLSSLS